MTEKAATPLADFHRLHVEIVRELDEELHHHLQDTILGTPGGMQYMHTNIRKKIEHIRDIYFMLLKKSGHLLGSVGLADRKTFAGEREFRSWYVRYFSIRAPLRPKKYSAEAGNKDASRSTGFLKSVALPYFENPALLDKKAGLHKEPSLLYACIEKTNFRSLRFSSDMGLRSCRNFTTVLFSRFKLKANPRVTKADPTQSGEIRRRLADFYSGHTLFHTGNILMGNDYFIYMENGKMIAGLQVHSDAWKIAGRGGAAGKFLLNILPKIPGVKTIFNPAHFRFLAVEGIWYAEGGEKFLEPLLETACATHRIHVAMIWFDTECPVLKAFDRNVNSGLLGRLVARTDAEIRARFYGFSDESRDEFIRKPAYMSAYDMI